jgi:hypothetical protein
MIGTLSSCSDAVVVRASSGLGATAPGATGPSATGASPSGFPYTVTAHSLISGYQYPQVYWNPSESGNNETGNPISDTDVALMPTSCTPSMTAYSPTAVSVTMAQESFPNTGYGGSPIMFYIAGCQISSGPVNSNGNGTLQSCSATASAPVSAGTYLTVIVSGNGNNIGIGGLAFSCQ